MIIGVARPDAKSSTSRGRRFGGVARPDAKSSTSRGRRSGWAALILVCATLAGCASPLTLPQAKGFADRSVTRYCRTQADCGKLLQTKAQRLNGRWLIDYDSQGRVLTVAVDDSGNTRLDIWNKR